MEGNPFGGSTSSKQRGSTKEGLSGNSSRNISSRNTSLIGYYADKIKEFHELRLGQQTMEEDANKFIELLRYVRYIKDEKVNMQRFLSGLP